MRPSEQHSSAIDGDRSPAMRFLCDEMLKRLGRWLRAAGYDTLIQENGGPDRKMLQIAKREGRLLLTRDRKLMEFRNAANSVILLQTNSLSGSVREISQRLQINWLYRPFTRCLLCNALLIEPGKEAWQEVPEESRAHINELLFCVQCGKLYWEGAHVRRMRRKLNEWQSKQPVG